ncbi:MAG TPA: hypothetical protein VIL63_07185 [Terriglobales bacterium]
MVRPILAYRLLGLKSLLRTKFLWRAKHNDTKSGITSSAVGELAGGSDSRAERIEPGHGSAHTADRGSNSAAGIAEFRYNYTNSGDGDDSRDEPERSDAGNDSDAFNTGDDPYKPDAGQHAGNNARNDNSGQFNVAYVAESGQQYSS